MIKLKDLLLEKTFKISKDVDYIYKNGGFKEFIEDFKKGKINYLNKIIRKDSFNFKIIKSDELKGIDSRKAHLANPVNIYCGVFSGGPFYNPGEKSIFISFNQSALYAIAAKLDIPPTQQKRLDNEITEFKIKASISHELSHWISDSLYNSYIGKLLNKAQEFQDTDIIKLNNKDVNMTYFEIDAQIHSIKEMKRNFKSTWDSWTLLDIFEKSVSLGGIARNLYQLYGQDILNTWQKMLIKRMHREKLLGKNMKNFVKGSDL